jgi:hypothetical protein
MPRPLTDRELAVLRAWLSFDVESAVELRTQLEAAPLVDRSCECGCSSIGFVHSVETANVVGVGVFPIDAVVLDDAGESIGGMVLLTKAGHLHDVDVHTWTDNFEFPDLDHVRFVPKSSEGVQP